jgi:hypothetical protein
MFARCRFFILDPNAGHPDSCRGYVVNMALSILFLFARCGFFILEPNAFHPDSLVSEEKFQKITHNEFS